MTSQPDVCTHLPGICLTCDCDQGWQQQRLAKHAAGDHCDACGTDQYPHGDKA